MAAESFKITSKDFSGSFKKIDKKLIILILAFFLTVFLIFYYRSKIIKDLEFLLPLPPPVLSVPTLLQKHSQVLQEAFSKADYGEIQVTTEVEIPLAELEKKFSRKGEDIATGSSYVEGYIGVLDSDDKSLVIRLSETKWIKTKLEEDALLYISIPEKDQLKTYKLNEGFSELKIGDWVAVLCASETCQSAKKAWVYRSLEETKKSLGESEDWTTALPLGWCPPVERCWERLIKFHPSASNTDVLMRGIVQSVDQDENKVTLSMEGGSAIVQIMPDTVFFSTIDPDFLTFSQIKKDNKLVVRCAFQAINCSHVDSVTKVE